MSAKTMAVSVLVNLVDQMTGGLTNLQGRLDRFGSRMQAAGRRMSTFVTAPLAGLAGLTLRTAGAFEASMNRVQAVSGATEAQFAALRAQAQELGATTMFSASEAADAMGFLAMAGFEAEDILEAMPGTLQLAASAQLDLARAADIVSNVLTGYRMETDELERVNDVLVTSFTSTNTNLEQLGEAMKYAGPVASAAGTEFEEVAAVLSRMGNAGIQGSMAGTSLRGAISRLLNPTQSVQETIAALNLEAGEAVELMEAMDGATDDLTGVMERTGLSFTDSQGRLLPLVDILRQLEPHADDAGLFMLLFGQRAGPAMAALVAQGSDALEDFIEELRDSGGTAERIAEIQMAGFNGAMRELRSAFEALQIAIADAGLLEWATDAARALAEWVRNLSAAEKEWLKWTTIVAGGVAVLGPLVLAIGFFASALAMVLSPIGLVITGVLALAAAAAWVYVNWDGIAAWFADLWDRMTTAIAEFDPIAAISAAWDAFLAWLTGLGDRAIAAVTEGWERFKAWFDWGGPDVEWPDFLPSLDQTLAAAQSAARAGWRLVQAVFEWSPVAAVRAAWSALADVAGSTIDGAHAAVNAGWNAVQNVFESWDASAALEQSWDGLADTAAGLAGAAAQAATDAWAGVTTAASDVWEGARTVASGAWEGITGLFGDSPDLAAIDEARAAWDELEAAIEGWSPAPAVERAMGEAEAVLAGLSWHDHGVRLTETLADGIRAGAAGAVAAVRGLAQELRDHLPSSPAKRGPLADLDRLNFGDTIARSIDPRPAAVAMRRLAAAALAAGAIGLGGATHPGQAGPGSEPQRGLGGSHGFAAIGGEASRHEVGGRIVVEAAQGTRIRNVQSDNPAVPIEVDRGTVVGRA